MAEKGRDPTIVALESVHAALKDLNVAQRQKVLSSVSTLLDLDDWVPPNAPAHQPKDQQSVGVASRPVGLVELVTEKRPGSNAQRIALFAYYREKTEGKSRFARDDLKSYFATAKITPAANYDRDFIEAVRKGWIHEDGADSYLTTKGIEAIESGFESERKPAQSQKGKTSGKKSGGRARAKPRAKKKR